jgi:hypothetical protein
MLQAGLMKNILQQDLTENCCVTGCQLLFIIDIVLSMITCSGIELLNATFCNVDGVSANWDRDAGCCRRKSS